MVEVLREGSSGAKEPAANNRASRVNNDDDDDDDDNDDDDDDDDDDEDDEDDGPQFVSTVNSVIQVVLSPKTISNEGMSNCFIITFFPRYLL